MKVLLDTHAFLWFSLNDSKLSNPAKTVLTDPSNEILISPANYWELAIKIGLGKYQLTATLDQFVEKAVRTYGLIILHIQPRHADELKNLPHHHRDPFDRLLVAQAIVENIPLVSGDILLDSYSVTRIW